jgi:hypothetical protein
MFDAATGSTFDAATGERAAKSTTGKMRKP